MPLEFVAENMKILLADTMKHANMDSLAVTRPSAMLFKIESTIKDFHELETEIRDAAAADGVILK